MPSLFLDRPGDDRVDVAGDRVPNCRVDSLKGGQARFGGNRCQPPTNAAQSRRHRRISAGIPNPRVWAILRMTGSGPYRMGMQRSATSGKPMHRRANSGPTPATSPTVIAIFGRGERPLDRVGSLCIGKVGTLDWRNLAGFVVMDPEPTRSLADAGGCIK